MTAISRLLKRQFEKPQGWLGQLAGISMAIKNRRRVQWAIELMNIDPSDKILEVGYGPGLSIELIAKKLVDGVVYGIDHSPVMYKQANHRNKHHIDDGKVILKEGTLKDACLNQNYFNKVLAINVHMFWSDPVKELAPIHNFLSSNGLLYIIFQHYKSKSIEEVRARAYQAKSFLIEAGFSVVGTHYKELYPVTGVAIVSRKNKLQSVL